MVSDIPYVNLSEQHQPIMTEVLEAVGSVISSGKYVLSEIVEKFENEFSQLVGTRYAVGVNSGTDALILSMRALGVGPGDEVITVPNSYITTASSIVLVGAKPVFVDVMDDYTIDVKQVESAITSCTKAILPVHLTGNPCAMQELMQLANKYDLNIIEDCAQAIGATYYGKSVGSFGAVGCFSLHPLKTLNACGDGGVVSTNNYDVYEKLRLLRNNGMRDRATCEYWSNNSRLDAIQAAILLVKMKYLDVLTAQRINNADLYTHLLSDIKAIRCPVHALNSQSVFHTYVVQAEDRDNLREYLRENGIKTSIHYPVPIHLQPCARKLGYKDGDFPVTETQSRKILSLPVHSNLAADDVEKITTTIRQFYTL